MLTYQKEQLLAYLEGYLTTHKKQLFEKVLSERTRHFTVVVEDIFQEHNAGAVVRTCDCFGIQEVHVIERHNNPKILHSIAKGAERWVDTLTHSDENLDAFVQSLKGKGYQIVATTPHKKGYNLEDFDISQKSALLFGTEQKGLSPNMLEQADTFLKINTKGFTESLNISVAAAVVLHYLTQKLRKSQTNWQLSTEEVLDKKLVWTIDSIANGKKLAQYFIKNKL